MEEMSPENEIRELERKLAEKRAALGHGQESAPTQEKEMLRETLRDHIEEIRTPPTVPAEQSVPTPPPSSDPAGQQLREEQIRRLIEIALTKSIQEAVKIAQANSPYLLDELHDHLVDDYYDKLVQLKKIQDS